MNRKLVVLISFSAVLIVASALLIGMSNISVQAKQSQIDLTADTGQVSNWPQQGFDAQRSSYNPNEWKLGPFTLGKLELLWKNYVPCTINSGPTVVDGIVYYGHYCGEFRAVDAASGEVIWTQEINRTETSHSVVNGVAYISARCTYTTCGMVYAFDADTGDIIWTWNPGRNQPVDLLVADNLVYVTIQAEDSRLIIVALDAETGALVWKNRSGGLVAIDNGLLYFTGSNNPMLYVLDADNGKLLWEGLVEGSRASRPVVAHQNVYIHSDDGHLYAFNGSGCGETTCSPLWVGLVPSQMGDDPQPPAVDSKHVFIGAGDSFYGFDAYGCGEYECAALWRTTTACQFFPGMVTPPSVANGVVYSPCGTNYIYAFDSFTGEILWQYYTSGGYSMRASPAIAEGRLYHAATFNFNLYAFGPPVGVYLGPPTQAGKAIPGENMTYELTLTNKTLQDDRFVLEYEGNNWATSLSLTETPTVTHGSAMTFTASVAVPAEAPWLSTDVVTVTAKSMTSLYTGSAQITTQVYAPPQISVSPTFFGITLNPDEIQTRILSIQNGYGIPLTFDLSTGYSLYDPVVQLRLDDPVGSAEFLDSSGYLNHGFCTGDYCPLAGVPGRYRTSLQFDGVDDYIQHPELVKDLKKGTISLWFRVNSWNPGYAGMYFWSGTTYLPNTGSCRDKFNLGAHPGNGDDQILFGIESDGWNWAESGVIPDPGQWYHLAGTWGPKGLKIYVNGELKGTNAYNGPAPWLNYNLIGSSSWPGTNIDGVIDEVSVHQRALNAEEIFKLSRGDVGESWLSINPSVGSVDTNSSIPIEITFDAIGINPGVYETRLTIVSNDPVNSLVEVPIVLTVLDPDG